MCEIDVGFAVSMERQVTGANLHKMRNLLCVYYDACYLDNVELINESKAALYSMVRPPPKLVGQGAVENQ